MVMLSSVNNKLCSNVADRKYDDVVKQPLYSYYVKLWITFLGMSPISYYSYYERFAYFSDGRYLIKFVVRWEGNEMMRMVGDI